MATPHVSRRTYQVAYRLLYGGCLIALGQMRAQVERQDIVRGTIVARIGAGLLAPVSELEIELEMLDEAQTHLAVTWRARARGGDRTILRAFLQLVDAIAARS
jgi:hypothetical protein